MSANWYMLTVVGKDKPGIVAGLTQALYEARCNLGEASMSRLGGNFTIMLMVQYESTLEDLQKVIKRVADNMQLHCHIDAIEGRLHDHREPDVRISVYGADRGGIVAQVTGALVKAGLDIYDLETDVGGSEEKPIFIMHIEGHAHQGIDVLEDSIKDSHQEGVQIQLTPIDTVIG